MCFTFSVSVICRWEVSKTISSILYKHNHRGSVYISIRHLSQSDWDGDIIPHNVTSSPTNKVFLTSWYMRKEAYARALSKQIFSIHYSTWDFSCFRSARDKLCDSSCMIVEYSFKFNLILDLFLILMLY